MDRHGLTWIFNDIHKRYTQHLSQNLSQNLQEDIISAFGDMAYDGRTSEIRYV